MSHNIVLKEVKLKDMSMLGSIVSELSQGTASLDMSMKKFRTYPGQPDRCDGGIRMPGRHDVGLMSNGDGSFSPVFDDYRMDKVFKSQHGTNYLGGLLQEYALREAEYEAAQRGFVAQRVEGEKGVITLELIAA